MQPDTYHPAPIDRFEGEWRFLSNFALCRIVLDDVTYPSVEHAYQAAKSFDPAHRAMCHMCTAGTAKTLGRRVVVRPDWESIKLDVMYGFLRQKFAPGTLMLPGLLRTGDAMLIEGNDWGDRYWGVCNGQGANMLGQLLMDVRAERRARGDVGR